MKLRSLCAGMAVMSLWPTVSMAEAYTDDQLLRNGIEAWNSDECVRAARFLFAYQLREPPALRANPDYRNTMTQMIVWCEANVRLYAGIDYKGDGGAPIVITPTKPPLSLNPPPVGADLNARRCDIYAGLAVAQNEANRRNACGFPDGGRWDSEFNNHFTWCIGQTKVTSDAEIDARQSLLSACVTPVTQPGAALSPALRERVR